MIWQKDPVGSQTGCNLTLDQWEGQRRWIVRWRARSARWDWYHRFLGRVQRWSNIPGWRGQPEGQIQRIPASVSGTGDRLSGYWKQAIKLQVSGLEENPAGKSLNRYFRFVVHQTRRITVSDKNLKAGSGSMQFFLKKPMWVPPGNIVRILYRLYKSLLFSFLSLLFNNQKFLIFFKYCFWISIWKMRIS